MSETNTDTKRVITRLDLVKAVARETQCSIAVVKKILLKTDDVIVELLSQATESEPVEIRLLDGLKLHGSFTTGKLMPCSIADGNSIFVSPRVRVKAEATRYFKGRVNRVRERRLQAKTEAN